MTTMTFSLLSACTAQQFVYAPEQFVTIEDVEMAPDGSTIFFSYRQQKRVAKLGVYLTETGDIFPMDLPNNISWKSPSISSDSRYLAIATYCWEDCPSLTSGHQIALLDLQQEDVNYRFLTTDQQSDLEKSVYFNPRFLPSGNVLLFQEDIYSKDGKKFPIGRRINKFDISKTAPEPKIEIKDEEQSFYSFEMHAAKSEDEIIISYIPLIDGPFTKLKKKNSILQNASSFVVYAHINNGKGSYEPFEKDQKSSLSNLDATESGEIFFVSTDTAVSDYDYELFTLMNGKHRQLTTEMNYIKDISISANGSKLALNGTNDIMIYDVATGTLSPTNIRHRIEAGIKAETQ
tara:strand:- start:1353 stop:2393 length:1041 start_codon:yes stop_codon:yes gene_type:complete